VTAAAPRTAVILLSGRGSNMRALIENSLAADSPFRIGRVYSDKSAAPGLAAARELGVPAEALEPRDADREAYDRELSAAVGRDAPALILLAGFMRILGPPFIRAFEGRILNIHPSLLPKYPGLHTHRRVLAAGDAQHGATVHFVTAKLDAGPAVLQSHVAVLPGDTENTLAARVLQTEHRMYGLAARWFCEDRLRCAGGHAWLDGSMLRAPLRLADVAP
jgi:phosphoribosylglycinamide formyltransferase-1